MDRPMLTPAVQPQVYGHIRGYCLNYPGVYLKGIGGTRDHLHLAVEIEPTVTIEEMIGKIKGASAREINRNAGMKVLRWQRGYGVISFAKLNLPGILRYIELQEQHHARGTIREKLENCGFMEPETEADAESEEREEKEEEEGG
jgi:hypothetical protein